MVGTIYVKKNFEAKLLYYLYMFTTNINNETKTLTDSGCSTAFIRVWAALGLATDLRTVETPTVQKALAEAAKTNKPLTMCLYDAVSKQVLAEEHYLKRG